MGYTASETAEMHHKLTNSPWLQMKFGGADDFELRSFQYIHEAYGEEAGRRYFAKWKDARTQGPPPTGPRYGRYADPNTEFENAWNERMSRQEWDEYEVGEKIDSGQWWEVEVIAYRDDAPTAQTATFVGTSTGKMRRGAARIIRNTPNHPLKFLLNSQGRFKSSRGLSHAELIDRPDIVQMGHITSKKSGRPERVMLHGAWENQLNNISAEHPSKGGGFVENIAIDIGGIAVDRTTAQFWEDIGWLKKGSVAAAPTVQ